ncbi:MULTISPECIES: glycosyltransferase [unclassified Pseudoalteromonas]|uniref:glycosyltransferase n=1 Tax=unclassified Pseudoalteromonas TaxID=194690 RepID=UPI0015F6AC26|nr:MULTISPECIES: glycosyltransferase [unclassified Pseudoalteromonas]MBA6409111.1 glycosyltransferase [Pseudoalteromonas sp. 5Ae-yellow]MDN3389523.1 glycosyltransferase [Pseudoalteromonas sp. APC 3691]
MLTIAISTVTASLNKLTEYLQTNIDKIDHRVNFLICSQREPTNTVTQLSERVKVIKTTESGLSRSRNMLIENSQSKWLWIQDDDIELEFEALDKLVYILQNSNNDLHFIKIKSLEDHSKFYKDYAFHRSHKLTNSLKISSIEIIVRREFVNANNIKFDTNLGLGTQLPCCEENKFILDLFKANAKVSYLGLATCYHTTNIESRAIDHAGRFCARGYLLRFYPFYIRFALMLRWAIKIPAELSFYEKMKLMLKNYIRK